MREFTKAMTSYTWAMSLYALQQTINVFRPGRATDSFKNVTKATEDEFGDAFKATFRAGDNLQRGLVDVTFGVLTLGMFDRGGDARRMGADAQRQTAEAVGQGGRAANQAVDIFTQSLQAAAQTFGVIAQSMTGMASGGSGCGGSRSQPAGWGPVPPPPSNTQR
jgi:hypothetical protein